MKSKGTDYNVSGHYCVPKYKLEGNKKLPEKVVIGQSPQKKAPVFKTGKSA